MSYLTEEFLEGMVDQAEREMLEDLTQEFKTLFPSRCKILGDENLNLFLTHQHKRAKAYGYEYYDDLKRYTLIAFYLGTYFYEDPFYPWVKETLSWDESFGVKVDSLMETFQELSQKTLGQDFVYFLEALEKFQELHPKTIENFKKHESVVNTLKRIYPQRVEVVGETILYEQLKHQKPELTEYNIHNALGAFTYLSTKFMLGSYVVKDPLYAWVRKYINKSYEYDKEKSRVLFDKAMSRVRKECQTITKNLKREEV